MFLKSLELKNVRCFDHLFVDFDLAGGNNRKWSVILGENGTGKSTLLRSLALILAGSDALSEILGEPANWVKQGAEGATIKAKIETQNAEERELELVILAHDSVSDVISRSKESLLALNKALEHTTRSYFVAAYGSTRRLGASSLSGKFGSYRQPRARSVATLFDRNAELNPLESWAMTLDYRSGAEGIDTVASVLNDFLPELNFSHIDKEQGNLIFETPDGLVPLQQLSDGYQNVAAWVGDLLFQVTDIFDDYKQPLHTRGLLIIDEVDLHLHPKWQRRLLDFLDQRLPKMQLVITTHSVVTAQQAAPGSLHYLVRREQGITIEDFEGDPGKLLINQLLMTEAFGNATDESIRTEQKKNRYRELYANKSRSSAELKEMKDIEEALGQPQQVADEPVFLTDAQRKLLAKMQKTYGGDDS